MSGPKTPSTTPATDAADAAAPRHGPAPARPRPRPPPLDPPMAPFALGGMAAWAVLGLVLLAFRGWLAAHGHTDWLWIALAGFLVGLPGLAVVTRHDARRRDDARRRAG